MQIRIDPHTLERAIERGATKEEIEQVLLTGQPVQAKGKRLAREKVFAFRSQRYGGYYEHKKVQVIYVL